MKKYDSERGSSLLRFFDRYLGIPIVFLLGIFKRKKTLPNDIQRIALLKTAAIGDTTILTAIIKDIEDYDANIKITLFTGSSNYEFAKLLQTQYKNLDVIKLPIKNPLKSIKYIRSKQFDYFLDFGPWPRLDAILSFFSNSGYRVGFKTDNQYRHYVYDKYVLHSKDIHELQNYKNILKVIGIKKDNLPQINFVEKKIIESNIVIHMFPGGSRSYLKEWPERYWIDIINYLTSKNYQIYLTGAKVDKMSAEIIKEQCKYREQINITAGEFSLADTIKLLACSKLVISVNTGVMHIASALQCNLIALHGPTNHKRWGPLNDNAIVLQSPLKCSPCLNLGFDYGCNVNKCMQSIYVDKVIESIDKML